MSILARRELRLAVMAALQPLVGTGITTLDSPGVRETAPGELPAVLVRTPAENKASAAKSVPSFNTTVSVELALRVSSNTDAGAQDALDALGELVEITVLGNPPLVALVQQVANVRTASEISGEGKEFLGEAVMTIDLETYEVFDPTVLAPGNYPPLEGVNTTIDTVRPFDPSGTYPNPPFPGSVVPAPRTTGPDGRAEGTSVIDLPQ